MIANMPWQEFHLQIDFSAGRSLAITLDPHGPQPSFFADEPAQSEPLQVGDYVGDVAIGGSCNAEVLRFIPHCHGTHTECVAHIEPSRKPILEVIDQRPGLARLVTLEASRPETGGDEWLELGNLPSLFAAGPQPQALIIRTLPNGADKQFRNYAEPPGYPVLSDEAMVWISAAELRHLLIDTPSLDRSHDGGKMPNHRCWWHPESPRRPELVDPKTRSVTEMIFVPDQFPDGLYWLHLELQPLAADATASRPVIYPVEVLAR